MCKFGALWYDIRPRRVSLQKSVVFGRFEELSTKTGIPLKPVKNRRLHSKFEAKKRPLLNVSRDEKIAVLSLIQCFVQITNQ